MDDLEEGGNGLEGAGVVGNELAQDQYDDQLQQRGKQESPDDPPPSTPSSAAAASSSSFSVATLSKTIASPMATQDGRILMPHFQNHSGSANTKRDLQQPPHQQLHSKQSLPPVFVSEAFNQEFSILSDMVSLNSSFSPEYSQFGLSELDPPLPLPLSPIVAPLSIHSTVSEDSIYDSVVEPYPYPASFHHMLEYAKQRLDKNQLFRLCQAYVSFRPNFVAAVKTLTRQDLIFVEKCFQRTILDFSKLLTYMGTPTCAWRRSGEIALVGQEFTILTQWPTEQLLSKQTFLFEVSCFVFFFSFFFFFFQIFSVGISIVNG